mgnify:CR=1 FL=1
MEGRATAKVSDYMQEFKEDMKDYILELECPNDVKSAILQQIYNYHALEFTKEDFVKRKRMKNVVPRCDRCCAKRANNDQCTRKRRDGSLFCGTHVKGTPHGTIENVSSNESASLKQVELVAQEIKGIIYYLDDVENVYKTEDVLQNKVNPSVIATYVKLPDGSYSIPEFNI